jgi:hypothetical protein
VLTFGDRVEEVLFIGFDQGELSLDRLLASEPIRVTGPKLE